MRAAHAMEKTSHCAAEDKVLAAVRLSALALGYSTLKPQQEDVLVHFAEGNDLFAVLPTGFGKSLCYACLPAIFDHLRQTSGSLAVVVTPLIAIMKDQVITWSSIGLKAAYVSAETQHSDIVRGVVKGEFQLIFFSPEMHLSLQEGGGNCY